MTGMYGVCVFVIISLSLTFTFLGSNAYAIGELLDEQYSEWSLFGTALDKQAALSDSDLTTGIVAEFNNEKQTFLVEGPSEGEADIATVSLFAQHQKGANFPGTTKFSFLVSDGTTDKQFGSYSVNDNLGEATLKLAQNPITELPWTPADFETTHFGFIQDTDNKPTNILTFNVTMQTIRLEVLTANGVNLQIGSAGGDTWVEVTDTEMMDAESVDVTVSSQEGGDTIILTLEKDTPGFFVGQIFFDTPSTINPDGSHLFVQHDDVITFNYQDLVEKSFISSNSGSAQPGVATDPGDPIRFAETDVYHLLSTATVIVRDDSIAGDTEIVTVVSPTGDVETLTATRLMGTDQFQTTAITLSTVASSPDDDILTINDEDVMTATYPGDPFIAQALVITDPGTTTNASYNPSTDKTVCDATHNDDITNPSGDNDGDGICDDWENNLLITTDTGKQYTISCDPAATYVTDPTGATVCPDINMPDVYVEADYFLWHMPNSLAIEKVVEKFLANNVQLHVDVDEELPHADETPFASGPGNFYDLKLENFGTPTDKTCPIDGGSPGDPGCDAEIEDKLTAKRQIYRYALFAHCQPGTDSSGHAERPGNDFLITLCAFDGQVGSPFEQASAFMHELGHTMNLRHGGTTDINCAFNHVTIMNYLYALTVAEGGVVTFGGAADEWDSLDYSHYRYTPTRENSLRDGRSIGSAFPVTVAWSINGGPLMTQQSNVAFDFDGDGVTESGQVYNLNNIPGVAGCDSATTDDYHYPLAEWSALVYDIRTTVSFDNGVISTSPPDLQDAIDNGLWDPNDVAPFLDAGANETVIDAPWEPMIFVFDQHYAVDVWIEYGDGTISDVFTVNPGEEIDITSLDHDYLQPGTYIATVHADNGLVEVTDTVEIMVVFSIVDFEIISPIDNSQYEQKRTIPLKFRLFDYLGNEVVVGSTTSPEVFLEWDDPVTSVNNFVPAFPDYTANNEQDGVADYTNNQYELKLDPGMIPVGAEVFIRISVPEWNNSLGPPSTSIFIK